MAIRANYPDILPTLNLDFANTKKLDPRITFVRTTTATYYDGKTTAKAEENLLPRSQEMDNSSWVKENVTVTANDTTAPDGTTTADKIIESATNTGHRIYYNNVSTINGSVYVYSCYLKKNERQYAVLAFYDNVARYRVFDLTNGTLGSSSANITSSAISDAGNGWYRCSIVFTCTNTGASYPYIAPSSTDNYTNYLGDGSSMWAWGAQLEQRSSLTAYAATTTAPITNYIPVIQTATAGQARFDHNPTTGESLGLLIEEARTNLLLRSAEFDNASWAKTLCTVTANQIIAPDGTLSADKTTDNLTSGTELTQTVTVTSGATITHSRYFKYVDCQWIRMIIADSSAAATNFVRGWFDIQNGVVGSTTVGGVGTSASISITSVGNGWYRCTLVGALTGLTSYSFGSMTADANTSTARINNGSYYVWGAQCEAGSFATSYIPTTSATVTRNADAASMTGTNFSSWYNAREGTIFADFLKGQGSFPAIYTIDDNTSGTTQDQNRIYLYRNSATASSTTNLRLTTNVMSASGVDFNGTSTEGKCSYGYLASDNALYQNSSTSATSTTPTSSPSGINNIQIGGNSRNTRFWNGTLKKLSYYPKRLSNTELQALSSV